MSSNNMSVWTTKIYKGMPDIARQYLFTVRLEAKSGSNISKIFGDKDDFIFRAKTASMPGKSFGEITTEYLGSKLPFAGKATTNGDLQITFDEFQDLYITQCIYHWQNMIYNHSFDKDDIDADSAYTNGITGGAYSDYANDYCCDIIVTPLDASLQRSLPVEFKFVRCYPKELAAAELGMEQEGKITRQVTFAYSTFQTISTDTADNFKTRTGD